MPRQHLANAPEQRVRAKRCIEIDVFVKSCPPDFGRDFAGRQNGLDFRAEDDGARCSRAVVEGLDAEPVSCQVEDLALFVPDRDGEHAVEHLERGLPPLHVGAQRDFGVRATSESVPLLLERLPQREVVVDFAVVDDDETVRLASHRLVAMHREIDDAQARVGKADWPARVDAAVVRATVTQRLGHAFQNSALDSALAPPDACDAAHSPRVRRPRP